jgi:polysaccharide pyruvyl transferase WcaK-like protein
MAERNLKIVICANPLLGSAAFAWRVKCSLENAGHTVFFFSPAVQSQLFEAQVGEADTDAAFSLRVAELETFFRNQEPHVLLTADNVFVSEGAAAALSAGVSNGAGGAKKLAGMTVGALCDTLTCKNVRAEIENSSLYSFVICAAGTPELAGMACAHVPAATDGAWAQTPIINTIAAEKCVIISEDATPEKISALRDVLTKSQVNHKVLAFGANWPEEFNALRSYNDGGEFVCGQRPSELGGTNVFAYAARASYAHLTFEPATNQNFLAPFAQAEGVAQVTLSVTEENGASVEAAAAKLDALKAEACAQDAHSRKLPAAGTTAFSPFDQAVCNAIMQVAPARASWGAHAGANAAEAAPRTIVTIMGYFGMGNFGDEYILATLERLIKEKFAGATVCAVSDNPAHTLRERGIYAISPQNHAAIDQALAHSSAAVMPAGLLFDQGIRWTSGKTSLFESIAYSDIPGLAAFTMLAHMNNTPVVFHGIGAGPLEEPDSMAMVNLLSRTRCVFTTRDVETGNLLRACGVNPAQVADKADTAFLGTYARTKFTPAWLEANVAADQQIFAISLRNYDENPANFAEIMAGVLDKICGIYENLVPVFCVLDQDDENLSKQVISHMNAAAQTLIFNAHNNLDAQVELLAHAHVGFSMRYHACLLMSSFGVPCVGINYLPKVGSLYAQLGAQDLLLDVTASQHDYFTTINKMIENRQIHAERTQQAVAPLRQLSREALEILYAEITKTQKKKARSVAQNLGVWGAYPTCVAALPEPAPKCEPDTACAPAQNAEGASNPDLLEAIHRANQLQEENNRLKQELEALKQKPAKRSWFSRKK